MSSSSPSYQTGLLIASVLAGFVLAIMGYLDLGEHPGGTGPLVVIFEVVLPALIGVGCLWGAFRGQQPPAD